MRFGRRRFTAIITLAVAAVTGHLMQHADGVLKRYNGAADAGLAQTSLTSASAIPGAPYQPAQSISVGPDTRQSLPDFPDLPVLEPVRLQAEPRLAASRDSRLSQYEAPLSVVLTQYDAYGQECTPSTLTLTHLRPAMIGVSVRAPCHALENVTVSHAGLEFSARVRPDGNFATTVPALAAAGGISLRFASGEVLEGHVLVPDLGSVSRYALVVRNVPALHVNGFVKGAAFGEAGHLRPENPGLPTIGLGGFLTVLGDPAMPDARVAEIFTQPARGERARVVLVAGIEKSTCGRDLLATIFAAEGTVVPLAGAVTFAMPECGAIGDHLAFDLDSTAFAPLARLDN